MIANPVMTLSDFGECCVKLWEEGSLEPKLVAYNDGTGTYTIAFGCTEGVYKGMTITADQAEAMFQKEIDKHVAIVRKYLKRAVEQCEFDALVSFTFNEGYRPTIFTAANSKNYKTAVPTVMLKYNKARSNGKLTTWPGLVQRRANEIQLWHGTYKDARIPIASPYDVPETPPASLPYAADPAQKPSRATVATAAATVTAGAAQVMPNVSDLDKIVSTGQRVKGLTEQAGDLGQWLMHSSATPWAVLAILVGVYFIWTKAGTGTSGRAQSDSSTQ